MDRTWVQDGATIRVARCQKRRYVPRTFNDATLTVSAIRLANPDIVHVHTTAYAYAAVKSGYPVVMTMHSIAYREALTRRSVRKYLLAGLELYLERVILNRIWHVIAISPNIAAYVRARSRAKVYEIPVAIDPEFFEIPNLDAGGRLLFVGQIYPRKGVLQLLRSLDIVRRKMPEVNLDIVGNLTDAKYLAALNAYIEQHQMSRHIRFLGRVDEAALKRAYAECRVLVLSALEEGTPAVLLEAMAAGKPVVATSVGGVPHIVDDGSNGFVVPVNDIQGFAERIIILLSNRGLREQMGQAAREKAERHRLETIMAQTVEVYRDVVAIGRRGS